MIKPGLPVLVSTENITDCTIQRVPIGADSLDDTIHGVPIGAQILNSTIEGMRNEPIADSANSAVQRVRRDGMTDITNSTIQGVRVRCGCAGADPET